MPRLIRTPEDIFREEHRDVYALEFNEVGHKLTKSLNAMEIWLTTHLPSSSAERIAPSVHLGWLWLEGVPSNLSMHFADGDLIKFFQKWLTPDGRSKDARFTCRFYSYNQWWIRHGHYMPLFDKPTLPGIAIWIETPYGILSHVLSNTTLIRHPSTVEDLWANACKKWPKLRALKLKNLRYGSVDKISADPLKWQLVWECPQKFLHDADKKGNWIAILDWLCLPSNTENNPLW